MSNLLEKASLVMIPSGYKEDVVYSQIPLDGSGDLTLTRASNGTRVNSAGLVEVCPWNLATYSEDFNSDWSGGGNGKPTMTNNFALAPNGTMTASKMEAPSDGYQLRQNNAQENTQMNVSVWLRTNTGTKTIQLFLNNGSTATQNLTVTTTWTRYEISGLVTTLSGSGRNGLNTLEALTSSNYILVWGFQLSVGLTLKPYFPTTDRLNVPRLTYQNGGGGCPSLLLEKQSTNVLSYSNTSDWGVSPTITKTQNTTDLLSPDGTNNATKIVSSAGTGDTSQGFTVPDGTITLSFYGRVASGTKTLAVDLRNNSSAVVSSSPVLTTEWQRFTLTNTVGGTGSSGAVWIYPNGAGTFYIYGVQIEASNYATSLILTNGASATRVADLATVNLPNTNMTFTAYLELDEASLGTGAGDWFSIFSNVSALGRAYGYANQFGFADAYSLGVLSGTKMVWKQESGSTAKIFKGGALVGTSTTGTYTDPFNRLRIDGALLDKSVKIKQFVFFDNALTDAECIQLTA